MTASNPTTPSSLLSRSPRRSIAPPFIAETFSGVAAKGRITVPLENNGVVCDASTCFDNTTLHRLTSSGGSGKSPSHLVPGCIGPSNHRLVFRSSSGSMSSSAASWSPSMGAPNATVLSSVVPHSQHSQEARSRNMFDCMLAPVRDIAAV